VSINHLSARRYHAEVKALNQSSLLVLANEISAKNQSWPKRVYVEMTAPARYLKAAKEAEEFIEVGSYTCRLHPSLSC
jgi:hypothetical protein